MTLAKLCHFSMLNSYFKLLKSDPRSYFNRGHLPIMKNYRADHYIMTPAKLCHFSMLKSDFKLLKSDPRSYFNRGHFSIMKNYRAGHFSMG